MDGLKALSREIYGEDAIERLVPAIDHLRYSTTQGTNAIVQRRGPRLGLLTDDPGLSDLLRTSNRDLFDQLVGDRVGITEGLDPAAITRLVSEIVARGANRLVVAAGAEHEATIKRTIYSAFPRHLLGAVPLLFSNDLTRIGRPARRAWSALINAFLHPSMEQFLYNAEGRLRGLRLRNPMLVFRNDGKSTRVAKTVSALTYSSGPRGGLEGLAVIAESYELGSMISIDVGGTTTDIARVEPGGIESPGLGTIAGVPVSFPLADIVSVGAGGSSILRVENGNVIVGPESVGSAPGPACFGRGGANATMTDVMLVAGLLDPESFFSGKLRLDVDRAAAVVDEHLARPLGVCRSAALSVAIDAYDTKIANALGIDAARYCLVAFGGAGPMSACGIAERAGIGRVLIPAEAAVFSAFGIGFSDIQHRYSAPLGSDRAGCEASMMTEAERGMRAEGFKPEDCTFVWSLAIEGNDEVRNIEPDSVPTADEAVSLVLDARRAIAHPRRQTGIPESSRRALPSGHRAAFDNTPVFDIAKLAPGDTTDGPCLIEDAYFTTWVRAGWRMIVTNAGDLLLTREGAEA